MYVYMPWSESGPSLLSGLGRQFYGAVSFQNLYKMYDNENDNNDNTNSDNNDNNVNNDSNTNTNTNANANNNTDTAVSFQNIMFVFGPRPWQFEI